MSKKLETMGFQSEVKELLQLMIHSLYSNKEIFLRELISNSADAADKLRYAALADNNLYEDQPDLKIQIKHDKELNTLTIIDNGIGMTREEVINNLGVIARSGTKEFIKQLGDKAKDSNLIGQFGVGFYSSFIVAKKVEVFTRKAGVPAEQGVIWSSEGEGEFQVGQSFIPTRGTTIVLHLKDDCKEFADQWKIRNIITTYSNHVNLPIELEVTKTDPETKETTTTFEVVNDARALWKIPKAELTDEDYKNFYQDNLASMDNPLTWSHNHVEGNLEYTSLLYIPNKAPFDLFQQSNKHGIKLYVQRVFIMDQADSFLPNHLRFVRGVLDTNSLPLNVSREILQDSRVGTQLKSALTKRVLSMLEGLTNKPEDYQLFWNEFGNVLKEGLIDHANKDRLQDLLRFASTYNESNIQNVSFKDYLSRLPKVEKIVTEGEEEKQEVEMQTIYYLSAPSYQAAITSPHLEWFKKNNIEVLLLTDVIDEWAINFISLNNCKLQDITKSDFELPVGETQNEEPKAETVVEESVISKLKDYFGDRVADVKTTNRLTSTASIVTTGNQQMNSQMAKLLKAMGQEAPEIQYTLEINPEHKLVKSLIASSDENFNDYADLLLGQALLAEKGSLEDPVKFITLVNKLI